MDQSAILVTVRVRNNPTIIATLVLDEKLQVSKSLSVRRNIVNPRVAGWLGRYHDVQIIQIISLIRIAGLAGGGEILSPGLWIRGRV